MQTRMVLPAACAAATAAGGWVRCCMSARAIAPSPDASGSNPRWVIWLNAVQSMLEGARVFWTHPGYQAMERTVRSRAVVTTGAGNETVAAMAGAGAAGNVPEPGNVPVPGNRPGLRNTDT